MSTTRIEKVNISDIEVNPGLLQAREKTSREVVAAYAENYRDGVEMPPIRLVQVGEVLYLVDGFHRLDAQKRLDYQDTIAEISEGTLADAMMAAASANNAHGLRRSKGDALRAAILAITALHEAGLKKNKRPTYEQVINIAKVGKSVVDDAFALLEKSGANLGEKDKRGRKRKVESTTDSTTERHTEYSAEDADVYTDDEGNPLTGIALLSKQADQRMREAHDLAIKVGNNLQVVDPADVADPNGDARLSWEAVAGTLEYVAAQIRATLGTAVEAGQADPDPQEGDTAEQARAEAAE